MGLADRLNQLVRVTFMYEVHRRLCPLISSKGGLIAHSPRNNDDQVENQPSRLSLLAAPLTGYHLLNIVSVLVFGIWKVVMSDRKGLVVVTRVELVLVMISGLVCAFSFLQVRERPGLSGLTCVSDCTTQRC